MHGLSAEAYHNKSGAFQGLRFYAGETKFKASQIDRSLSKQNLELTLERKLGKRIDGEFLLAHKAEQKLENVLQEKRIPYKSERTMAQSFDLISTLLTANPYQINLQINQDHEQEEEERKNKLENKKARSLGRF